MVEKVATRRECPIEYLQYAIRNPELFAQEFLSFPSGAVNPFFRELPKVTAAINKNRKNPLDESTYAFDPEWKAQHDFPCYMHIDLARNQDAVGLAMSHTKGTMSVEKIDLAEVGDKVVTQILDLPLIEVDFCGRLHARKHLGEKVFDFRSIISLVQEVHNRGFNLKGGLITFDRFQSLMLMDALVDMGFVCGLLSVDHTSRKVLVDFDKDDYIRYESIRGQPAAAMIDFREAITQERIIMPEIPMFDDTIDWFTKEAAESMWNPDKGKAFKMIAPGASDDLLQGVVGSCFNCAVNSEDQILPSIDGKNTYNPDEFYKGMPGMEEEGDISRDRGTITQHDLGFYGDEFDLYKVDSRMDGLI